MKLCKHCNHLREVDENGYCLECSFDYEIPKEHFCRTCSAVIKESDETLSEMIEACNVQPCGHGWEVLS